MSFKSIKIFTVLLVIFITSIVSSSEFEDVFPDGPTSILFWNQDQKIFGFKNMDKITPDIYLKNIYKNPNAKELDEKFLDFNELKYSIGYEAFNIDEFFKKFNTAGLIVVYKGDIVFEKYALGNNQYSKWVSFSVTKSVTSMLVGAAIQDGFITSENDRVTKYIPELKGSAYQDATIKNILNMASGVAWNEDYSDFKSDVSICGGCNSLSLYEYLKKLPIDTRPGRKFNYNTAESNLLGGIVRAAVGEDLSKYLERKIWQPFGMTSNAFWATDFVHANKLGGCCINATLRDYAKIGLFASRNGQLEDGTKVLPNNWMKKSISASKPFKYYGYKWWLDGPGYDSYRAQGIFGQLIWIDPKADLIIAMHSVWEKAIPNYSTQAHRNALIGAIYKKVVR